MSWLESHQSLRDHPKKEHLAELLFNGSTPNDVSDYAAAGVLHYLWYWALDYAQDGDLSKFSDRQVAKGCRWQGDPLLLMQALTTAGFIDKKTRQIHDWDDYAGKLIQKREQDRDRKAAWRVHVKGRGQNADVPRDGARTDLPTYLKANGTGPVDNSTVRTGSAQDRKCWRCGQAIDGDDLLDDKCVLSRKGLRHVECAP